VHHAALPPVDLSIVSFVDASSARSSVLLSHPLFISLTRSLARSRSERVASDRSFPGRFR
jgi:hypothetical protein